MARTRLFSILERSLRQARRIDRANQAPLSDEAFAKLKARRDFLKSMSAAAAFPAVSSLIGASNQVLSLAGQNPDPILIIGAGVAGLSAAYKLKKANVPFLIIEAADRVGGRIWTERKMNEDGQFAERGGELIDTNHALLLDLARELGLEIEDFSVVPSDGALFFFAGKLRSEAELAMALLPLIKVIDLTQKKVFPNGVQEVTYRTAAKFPHVHEYDNMTLAQFLEKNRGKTDAWAMEAIRVAYVGEYGREADEQSTLNLLTLVSGSDAQSFSLLGVSDETMRIKGGNEQIVEKLLETLGPVSERGKFLKLNCHLKSLKEKTGGVQVTYTENGSLKEKKFARVICTIPFSALREVDDIRTWGLSALKTRCIREMGYGQHSKILMDFKKRFWKNQPKNMTEVMFTDGPSQVYWETSRLQTGERGVLTNYLGGKVGSEARVANADNAIHDLEIIFPGSKAFYSKSVIQNWTQAPTHRGSYSCLLPGQWTTIWGAAEEDEWHGKLIFAGEHTSVDFQGYMNGGIESGFAAAEKIVGAQTLKKAAHRRV